ncbi:MAG: putative metal-dependent hydrolase [Bacteroidetes bacterium]|nr:MAG: putative metal-dependent hydrolase [Bacteroidota bacterium]
MSDLQLEKLRFPVGRSATRDTLSEAERVSFIQVIENLPAEMNAAVAGLDDAQLDTPYRADGWTVRQVVHHVADSHMNAFIRFRLALTEEGPTIKTYEEKAWAELVDSLTLPVAASLGILEGLHARWTLMLRHMSSEDFARVLLHPDRGLLTLDEMLCLYEWHSRHHVAHISSLRQRMGW